MITRREGIMEIQQNGWNVYDEYKTLSLENLKRIVAEDRLPFSVMVLNLFGDLNVGNIIRTSHILGARVVFVVGHSKIDGRSLVGADKYFNVVKISALNEDRSLNVDQYDEIVRVFNLNPILIETGGTDYKDYDWSRSIVETCKSNQPNGATGRQLCLVVGNETIGIPDSILRRNKNIVSVPQRGVLRSLNVSAAFAIICAEVTHKMSYYV